MNNNGTHFDSTIVEDNQNELVKCNKKPYLVVFAGKDRGKRYPIDEKLKFIGRGQELDIAIDDERISRVHSSIENKNGKIIVTDCSSTNGTFIDGTKINTIVLSTTAILQIGRTAMKLEFKSDSEILYEDNLLLMATRDGLTRLYNRAYFMQRAKEELVFALRLEAPLGVVLMDIDHFKLVNDTHGHLAGDYILQQIGTLIASSVREVDLAGRYGGEEFVVLLRSNVSKSGMQKFGERLRKTIEKHTFLFNKIHIPITISLGYYFGSGARLPNLSDILDRADQALYTAKQSGRNRVEAWKKADIQKTLLVNNP